ncbi:hypothetical protein BG011_003344 [Mortierella polycephala]|uniref:Phosphatidate phosphatase APP1 catalytic domain-containing protein n=1 Tax=Mortierella polycephala TaxID=41804 RepID=A0A9P6Q4A6_9FUNG|nr:hypothetical protein BG011_003344 [Mortierella polycephala]
MDQNQSSNCREGGDVSTTVLSSQPPPLPQRQSAAQPETLHSSQIPQTEIEQDPKTEAGTTKETILETSADVEQHCLLFPTYATRYSQSGSKDPRDWNIRVRGWAFSKRSNRRKRLVMSMARKLARVTNDSNVYGTLESRFGMFLASNTQGASFLIQCVGLAKTSQMELAGDPSSHDPTVDVLMNEFNSSEGALAAAEVVEDKAKLRKSLQVDDAERAEILGHGEKGESQNTLPENGSKHLPSDGGSLARTTTPGEQEDTITDKWSKGAAFLKGAYRKYKPLVMAQVNSGHISSDDSIKAPSMHQSQPPSTRSSSAASDSSACESSTQYRRASPANSHRTDSFDSAVSQNETYIGNLGCGMFPTIRVDSQPGGHFNGTLQISHEVVQAFRRQNKQAGILRHDSEKDGDPRFLKLHAHHPEMREHCHGTVNLIDPKGVSIISDIDDTIKETNVTAGARTILENTFLRDMQAVHGMPGVYKSWWEQGAVIHYVSNSPWQLIPSLLDFFHNNKFPPGSAHLRLHDNVLKTYFMSPGEHKRKTIREILTDFPERKFILIGDSGEIDMEVYTEMAMEFKDQVLMIFIRDITSARLKESVEEASTSTGSTTRSFASIIPKAPINAVTEFFSRQGDNASSVAVNVDKGKSDQNRTSGESVAGPTSSISTGAFTQPGYTFVGADQGAIKGREITVTDDTESLGSSAFEEFDPTGTTTTTAATTPGQSPPQIRSPSIATTIVTTTPETMSTSASITSTATATAALDDEPMPGAIDSGVPAPIKNPYEIWMDRVERCRKKLRHGKLVFFDDAESLAESQDVKEILQEFVKKWDEEDEDDDKVDGMDSNGSKKE